MATLQGNGSVVNQIMCPPQQICKQRQRDCKSYFTTGGLPPISSSWRQAPWDSRPSIHFQLNTCCHNSYVISSVTRGWVYSLQLLLTFASAFILRSDSRGTHDHILLSEIRDSPKLEIQVPVFQRDYWRWNPLNSYIVACVTVTVATRFGCRENVSTELLLSNYHLI
jgi:hypothetical protein